MQPFWARSRPRRVCGHAVVSERSRRWRDRQEESRSPIVLRVCLRSLTFAHPPTPACLCPAAAIFAVFTPRFVAPSPAFALQVALNAVVVLASHAGGQNSRRKGLVAGACGPSRV